MSLAEVAPDVERFLIKFQCPFRIDAFNQFGNILKGDSQIPSDFEVFRVRFSKILRDLE